MTIHFFHARCASAWCQTHAEVPCSVANGATYSSDPTSVRIRYAENSTAKALAISAPGAAKTCRSPRMLSTLLVFTISSLKYCSVHRRAWVESLGQWVAFPEPTMYGSPVTEAACDTCTAELSSTR